MVNIVVDNIDAWCNHEDHVRHDASRHFRNKKNDYLKAKIEELEITVRKKLLGICIGASMTLRRVTSLELIQ